MNKFNRRIILFTIPVLFFFGLIAAYNYWLDPFGVIKGDMSVQKTEPNQRYLKMKHLLNNPKKYNAFVFGTSRIGRINVSLIPDKNNWYNFTYSEGVPAEHLTDIKMLLENNVEIKRIIIGLDDMSYLVNPALHKSQTLRKAYVDEVISFDYLFLTPSYSLYKKIQDEGKREFYSPKNYETIYKTGVFLENKKDTFIEKQRVTHQNDPIFKIPFWNRYYFDRISATINEISDIIEIADQNNIELIFLFNPLHISTYMYMPKDDYYSFLKQLVGLTEFYDFSGVNPITTNNYNYYETSHYRPFIGNQMIDIIFNDKPVQNSFGILVNKSNIDEIIERKKTDIIEYKRKNTFEKDSLAIK